MKDIAENNFVFLIIRVQYKKVMRSDLKKMSWMLFFYTTFTNFSMEYYLMCKVYTDVGGIK